MNYEEIANIIESVRGDAVDFGDKDSDLVPSTERIAETENLIGHKLPPSYVWFLRNYGGGTVYGDQIFCISKVYSIENSFDVASRTLSDRKNGLIKESEISICVTDFGEQFILDVSTGNDEYSVVRKTGEERKIIADSFVNFLTLMIRDDIP